LWQLVSTFLNSGVEAWDLLSSYGLATGFNSVFDSRRSSVEKSLTVNTFWENSTFLNSVSTPAFNSRIENLLKPELRPELKES